MVLVGRHDRTLDDKLRVAIPREFREALALPSPGALYIAPGTDGSLWLFREEEFARFGQRLAEGSPTERHVRDFSRLFYAQARRLELDAQGRIRLPADIAQQAGLRREVSLIGVQDHLELWDKERWEMYIAARRPEYDRIAEAAFGGPGAQPGPSSASGRPPGAASGP